MRKRLAIWMAVIALPIILGALWSVRAAELTPTAVLTEADRLYNERSYASALDLYRKALAGQPDLGARQPQVEYRICVSLGRSQKWDEALAQTAKFIEAHPTGLWAARGHYWLAQLYTVAPHRGYRVAETIYRGDDFPKVQSAEQPERVDLSLEDWDKAFSQLEQAKLLYQALRPRQESEEVDVNFDLAQALADRPLDDLANVMLELGREQRPGIASRPPVPDPAEVQRIKQHDWSVDPQASYRAELPIPHRVLLLYDQIGTLDRGRRAPLARYGKALYLESYQRGMSNYLHAYDRDKTEWVPLSYPYQQMDVLALLRSIAKDFPTHEMAPQAQLAYARRLEGKNQYPEARAAYRELTAHWPESKWASNALDRIQDIEWPVLTLNTHQPGKPGEKAIIWIDTRNLKTIRFTAYRIKLEEVLLRDPQVNTAGLDWRDAKDFLDGVAERRRLYGEQAATWTYTSNDTGKYEWTRGGIPTPLTEVGAYAIEAQAGSQRAATWVVITDLAMVQRGDKDRTLVFVCNAATGRPVPEAMVAVRERYHQNGQELVSVLKGQSDAEGLFSKPMVRGPGIYSNRAEGLAWTGNRYAVTPQMWSNSHGGDNRGEYRAYAYTDRPVYRPGQTVNYRFTLTRRVTAPAEAGPTQVSAARYEPVVNQTITVQVNDVRGDRIYQTKLTTNEFGSANGSLPLGAEASLGVYHLLILGPRSDFPVSEGGASQFRVEEYKKPEFEVTVKPAADMGRVGDSARATIQARYYFGSPVVGGKVTYRVFRTPFHPRYRSPRPYDWLTRNWREGDYDTDYRNGEVIAEGAGDTDEQGQLAISWDTKEGGRSPNAACYRYTVEAEVTDPSRRTITGSGEVRISRQQFFAFLDADHGFYQAGDRVVVELMTLDPMEQPISAKGTMRVVRLVRQGDQTTEQVVENQPIETNAQGRAFFRWQSDAGGCYRFAFEALDEWEQRVNAGLIRYVHGPGLDNAAFHRQGVEVIPDKDVYEEGDTCRLLIVSDYPDSTVLLTQQAGNQIMARAVLPIEGRFRVVEVKLNEGHVPNFSFHAVMVNRWQAYQSSVEIFVPPAKRFLNVSVESDRADYRPGDQATFRLRATDHAGNPARAELSLGVVDASVYYIQKEFAPDPRMFFYGQRRYTNVNSNWSLQTSVSGLAETDVARLAHKVHELTTPLGMGQLEDWPPDLRQGGWGGMRYRYGNWNGVMLRRTPDSLRGFDEAGLTDRIAFASADAAPGMGGGGAAMPGGLPGALPPSAPLALAQHNAILVRGEASDALAEATVRTQFADTAYWSPSVVTGADGTAEVTVTMPENLTTWRATTRGLTTEVQVGQATMDTVTRKDLIVRLQAPRFFMERDLVVLSANVHNYLSTPKRVRVQLALDGGTLELVSPPPADLGVKASATAETWVEVPKDGERRVDWVVRVLRSGNASVKMVAQTDEESDATQMEFPCLVHGAEKFEAQMGALRDVQGTQQVTLTLDLPRERRRGATELNLQLNPSLAATALDALPYLADYPYGCIEQTVSRFVPSVVVAKTLSDLGVNLGDLSQRARAYAAERTAGGGGQADSGYTYPKGMPGTFKPAELIPWRGPTFDPAELKRMVNEGLQRIYRFQHGDGGWGWWQDDVSDPYMTAYVCYGLHTAQAAGWPVRREVIDRGFAFLGKAIPDEGNLQRQAYLCSVYTLRTDPARRAAGPVVPVGSSEQAGLDKRIYGAIRDKLYPNRMKLTAYSQALLAISLQQIGDRAEARIVVDNLRNTAHIDEANGTANWMPQQPGWWWWHWWDNPVETNAAVIRAYVAVAPDDPLLPMMIKWMVNNRRGNRWNSTKETAMAVYALADYIRAKRELASDYTVTVDLEGKVQRTYRVNRDNALFFDNRFIVGDDFLGNGPQKLTITVTGNGTLYYSAYLKYFSLEEDLKGGGNEILVQRKYFKLTPRLVTKEDHGRTWKELTYDRATLASGARLQSGDLIEVELVIDAKNDYDYVVFEDMKPAGCEPVEVRSGSGDGSGVYSQMELRDERVAFFISNLPQGTRAVRYRLRAEIPGVFHALPTSGYCMYAPDVRCLSDEWRSTITEGE